MNPDQIADIVIVSLVTGCMTLSLLAFAWAWSRKHKRDAPAVPRLDGIEARLARMEDALDTIAVEIERVTEGQRFAARLLAERAASEAQGVPRSGQQSDHRRITPH
jgi:hypothetical protein